VTAGLDAAGVAWERNARLVRGLDYYRHTAFEFVTDRLGAQGTVLGGGRYDGLIENLGGPATPAVGWAAGIERLAMLLADDVIDNRLDAVIAVEDDGQLEYAMRALAAMRSRGLATEIVATGSPRKRFDKAGKIPARALIAIGSRDGQSYTNIRGDSELTITVDAIIRTL